MPVPVAVRVIPCLDVHAGRVVKGVNFVDLRDAGDPVELGAVYDAEGADELTFLDISASSEGRETTLDVVRRTAETVFIPLTVGGGVGSVADVDVLLRAGADKVAINTGAIRRPEVIGEITRRFGNQVLVLSVDARRAPGMPSGFEVTTHGGRRAAGLDAVEWARRGVDEGVGEILLNSMDADGTTAGFDLEMIAAVRAAVDVPLIASGGAGRVEDFPPAVAAGADAVLAATVFHFGTLRVADVKDAIAAAGHPVRRSVVAGRRPEQGDSDRVTPPPSPTSREARQEEAASASRCSPTSSPRPPSPEDCIFCRIVAGELPSRQVYADEHAVAFLDINAWHRGHTLVVPRRHVVDLVSGEPVAARDRARRRRRGADAQAASSRRTA